MPNDVNVNAANPRGISLTHPQSGSSASVNSIGGTDWDSISVEELSVPRPRISIGKALGNLKNLAASVSNFLSKIGDALSNTWTRPNVGLDTSLLYDDANVESRDPSIHSIPPDISKLGQSAGMAKRVGIDPPGLVRADSSDTLNDSSSISSSESFAPDENSNIGIVEIDIDSFEQDVEIAQNVANSFDALREKALNHNKEIKAFLKTSSKNPDREEKITEIKKVIADLQNQATQLITDLQENSDHFHEDDRAILNRDLTQILDHFDDLNNRLDAGPQKKSVHFDSTNQLFEFDVDLPVNQASVARFSDPVNQNHFLAQESSPTTDNPALSESPLTFESFNPIPDENTMARRVGVDPPASDASIDGEFSQLGKQNENNEHPLVDLNISTVLINHQSNPAFTSNHARLIDSTPDDSNHLAKIADNLTEKQNNAATLIQKVTRGNLVRVQEMRSRQLTNVGRHADIREVMLKTPINEGFNITATYRLNDDAVAYFGARSEPEEKLTTFKEKTGWVKRKGGHEQTQQSLFERTGRAKEQNQATRGRDAPEGEPENIDVGFGVSRTGENTFGIIWHSGLLGDEHRDHVREPIVDAIRRDTGFEYSGEIERTYAGKTKQAGLDP